MELGGSRRLRASIAVAFVLVGFGGASLRHPFGRRPDATLSSRPATSETSETPATLPATLAETGLYLDFDARTIAPDARSFSPQYPLWTDGATKRRWIRLPKGATIDASNADVWQFPVGTKLWKEFSFGRPVETRFVERTATGWRFASYAWSEDGKTARLANERGQAATGIDHRIPSRGDCRVCHENSATPVLGFSALQLSPDRDPNAPHAERAPAGALDLDALTKAGLVRDYTGSSAPRIVARTPTERAALGYLHANCGTCHRTDGAIGSLGMVLVSSTARATTPGAAIETTVGQPSRAAPERLRIARGEPDRSLLLERMRSRSSALQMPPLGTRVVDDEAVRLMTTWINELPN